MSDPLSPRRARFRRFARRVVLVLVLLPVVLMAVGAVYQALGSRRDAARLPPPGTLVSIGTHRMHIHCTGTEKPTILLDAGAGGWSLHWASIRPLLDSLARVCAFDRSGAGWSDKGPGAYDGEAIAREVDALLRAAGETDPVLYVGHSLGANLGLIHYGLFPANIAGLVLIDPGRTVDMLEDFAGTRADAEAITSCGWTCWAATAATRTGLVRLLVRSLGSRYMADEVVAAYRAGMARPFTVTTFAAYLTFLPKTAWQQRRVEDLGDLPLSIVYSGNTRRPEGDETEADVAAWHAETLEDMRALAARSTRGTGPLVVDSATHSSIVLAPEYARTVAAEILRVRALLGGTH
ncbi:MAG: alpha/beta hydrolase [Gemmatimonadota bacterium]|nr:alpha/beta hydrolase [Gemmatimonadota bacterium]MDH5197360.1 alpha/beta hydrolase [Gemmatimonadota bacterium]